MNDSQLLAKNVKCMFFCRFDICECGVVIDPNDFRFIAEMSDCKFYELNGIITAIFREWVYKPFPGSLINHGVLAELLTVITGIAGARDMFNIHLPFNADILRRVIRFGFIIVCRRDMLFGKVWR